MYELCFCNGELVTIKYIIENGGNINNTNNYGETPLIKACQDMAEIHIVKYLVENSSDINKAANNGETPLYSCMLLQL